jgi:hypothetical protein
MTIGNHPGGLWLSGPNDHFGVWDVMAEDIGPVNGIGRIDRTEKWIDKSVIITVRYCDAKADQKEMVIRVPPWKAKACEWLSWLRGLVGW